MADILMQADPLPEFHRALREQFQTGESIWGALLALLAMVAVVALAYTLTEYQRRKAEHAMEYDDPRRLFRDVLGKLNFEPGERQVLTEMTRELRLGNPTAILLSETLFDRQVSKWRESRVQSAAPRKSPLDDAEIKAIRDRLFPTTPSSAAGLDPT
jgi:hypothetical protein